MKYNKNVVLGNTLQLIQINRDIKNFKANITLESINEDDDYYILVTTQDKLDNSNLDIDFKKITHYISIDVENNNDKLENYILVLKSNNNVKLNITIDLTNLEEQNYFKNKETKEVKDINEISKELFKSDEKSSETKSEDNSNTMRYIIYGLVIVLICGGIYYYYFVYKKDSKPIEIQDMKDMKVDINKSTVSESVPKVEVPKTNETLLDKLRKIRDT